MKRIVLISCQLPLDGFNKLPSDFELLVPESGFTFKNEVKSYLPMTDAMVSVFGQSVTSDLMDLAPKLRLIANYGVGYDNVDVDGATSRGIVVTNTPDPVTEPTAELTMGLMLAVARNIVGFHNGICNNSLPEWSLLNNLSTTLYGKTLGIIGMGAIGKAMARRAIAAGMQILYHNRNRLEPSVEAEYQAEYCSFNRLLEKSDYVSLHVPLSSDTYQMIGKTEFKLMKKSAYLINTSRGNVVDEEKLIQAIQSKEIAGAGLDVYSNEPHIPQALKEMPGVVLTPHSGTGTYEARADMSRYVADIIRQFFNGEVEIPIVNPEVLNTEAFRIRSDR